MSCHRQRFQGRDAKHRQVKAESQPLRHATRQAQTRKPARPRAESDAIETRKDHPCFGKSFLYPGKQKFRTTIGNNPGPLDEFPIEPKSDRQVVSGGFDGNEIHVAILPELTN